MTALKSHAREGGGEPYLDITLRIPTDEDARSVPRLIASCPPLDQNSLYCNLLQCTHFSKTCVLAERNGEIIGWVSGYISPDDPKSIFVWQVAVDESARGLGLARQMINQILSRPVAKGVERILTTITPSNQSSWALFSSLAKSLGAPISDTPYFERDKHFDGRHETENLVTIGPFASILNRTKGSI